MTKLIEIGKRVLRRAKPVGRGVYRVLLQTTRAIKPMVDVLVPFVLIWLAFRTDELQRNTVAITTRQANIAEDQSTILRRQADIAAVQNMAAFGFLSNESAQASGNEGHSSVAVNNDGAPVAALRIYAFSYWMVTVHMLKWDTKIEFPVFAQRATEELSGRTSGPIAQIVVPFRKTALAAMTRQLDWQEDRIADDPPKGQDIRTLGGMPEILTVIEIHYTDRADGVHVQTYQVSSYKSGWQKLSKSDAMIAWRLAGIRGPAPDEGFAMTSSELTEEQEDRTAEEWYKTILEVSKCPIYGGKQESAWRATLKGVPQEKIDRLAAQYEIPKGDFEMSEHLLRRDGNICEDQP